MKMISGSVFSRCGGKSKCIRRTGGSALVSPVSTSASATLLVLSLLVFGSPGGPGFSMVLLDAVGEVPPVGSCTGGGESDGHKDADDPQFSASCAKEEESEDEEGTFPEKEANSMMQVRAQARGRSAALR